MLKLCTHISVLLFAAIALTSCGGGGGDGNLPTLEELTGDPCDNPHYAAEPGNNCERDVDDDEMTITPPDDGDREYTPTWFTCSNNTIAEYGYGACIEYLLSTRSLHQQFEQSCRNGPGRFLGDGRLCYGIYGRPAFGGTSPGCQLRNSSGTEIRYELYNENSYKPTREELIASCRRRGGTLR